MLFEIIFRLKDKELERVYKFRTNEDSWKDLTGKTDEEKVNNFIDATARYLAKSYRKDNENYNIIDTYLSIDGKYKGYEEITVWFPVQDDELTLDDLLIEIDDEESTGIFRKYVINVEPGDLGNPLYDNEEVDGWDDIPKKMETYKNWFLNDNDYDVTEGWYKITIRDYDNYGDVIDYLEVYHPGTNK